MKCLELSAGHFATWEPMSVLDALNEPRLAEALGPAGTMWGTTTKLEASRGTTLNEGARKDTRHMSTSRFIIASGTLPSTAWDDICTMICPENQNRRHL